ncbi:MAG: helix-turn-helix domain-containing protein [Muribaculaceae bacterium]|nr:helix-turn-helix domain-containing protein [Muribaculaceae bacterium]
MDIVARLKVFINYLGIPVTQFADNCRIPRPTLSQLLNGRNKKVSDELIGKIHDTYPELSVLWLMFGEGDMLHKKNIEISEPQNSPMIDFGGHHSPEKESSMPRIDFGGEFTDGIQNSVTAEKTGAPALESAPAELSLPATDAVTDAPATFTFNADQAKKIVNIIVYYNDNSFESFIPSGSKK